MSEQTTVSGMNNWFARPLAMWHAFMHAASIRGSEAGDAGPRTSAVEEQFEEMRETWLASMAKWAEFAQDPLHGKVPTPDELREMFSPASWTAPGKGALDAALKGFLEGPRYATLFDFDRKLLELQQGTLQLDREVAAYQAVMQKAWTLAFERFAKAITAGAGDGTWTWRALTNQWLATANETLIEVQRSDDFLQAQRRMLRAASDRRLQERRVAEAWCEATHVPTRSEVDELQRQVVELRRELRLLKRALQTSPHDTPTNTDARTARASALRARPGAKRSRA